MLRLTLLRFVYLRLWSFLVRLAPLPVAFGAVRFGHAWSPRPFLDVLLIDPPPLVMAPVPVYGVWLFELSYVCEMGDVEPLLLLFKVRVTPFCLLL